MSEASIQKTGETTVIAASDGRVTLSVPIRIKRRSGRKLVTLPSGDTAKPRSWDTAPTSLPPSWMTRCRITSRCSIWRWIRRRCGRGSGSGCSRSSQTLPSRLRLWIRLADVEAVTVAGGSACDRPARLRRGKSTVSNRTSSRPAAEPAGWLYTAMSGIRAAAALRNLGKSYAREAGNGRAVL
jgi:hypothetical protein